MAVGDLSPDQSRYAQTLVAATGLDPAVVAAWIGSESGWGVNKNDHNYLNIGPGRSYGSTDQAAGAAASMVRGSSLYKSIRDAISISPAAQVAAIEASPWDAGHYGGGEHRLKQIWQSVTGKGASINVTGPSGIVQTGFHIPGTNITAPGPGDVAKGIFNLTGTDRIVAQAVNSIGGILLSMVFTTAALALIGLGLARLTGHNAHDLYAKAQEMQGQAQQAAMLAAMA